MADIVASLNAVLWSTPSFIFYWELDWSFQL